MWISITDLGDSSVGLTLAALVLIVLLASGWLRGAIAWFAAVAGCGAMMAALKVAFHAASQGCGAVAAASSFSPSGHAALSTAVYGGLAVLSARQVPVVAQLGIAIASAAVVLLIATSRVAIQAHSPVEVAAGLAVGLGAIALLIHLVRRQPAPRHLVGWLAAVCVVALVWMYGTHWPVEENLHRLAAWLRNSSGDCAH